MLSKALTDILIGILAIIVPSDTDGSVIWHFKRGASLMKISFLGLIMTCIAWFCEFLSCALGSSPEAGSTVKYLSTSTVSGPVDSVRKLKN